MKFKFYKSRHSWFKFIFESYDLQGDEFIHLTIILFKCAFQLQFEPKRAYPHFEIRFPPTVYISRNKVVTKHKCKVYQRYK